ncbi:DUF4148 domain-containing protein [Burkholderia sp. Ax-1719]|uniref:DUF4148 domain-containing protein n=1 Tax=Burkholderia sp. Ax-1719 TaxID=2608334 RepID=UPI00141F22C2|nr:DUF4148 domain-containing protein [Burkholderia sp. Ax-1719]NIE68299.1 DUF4148 domain-containing protein [Burkholderia sp. Ax-1719]
MKSLIQAVVIATACAAPLAAFAQADQGLTREQVRAQLVEFQQTSRNQNVAAAGTGAAVTQGDSAYGGVSSTSAAGAGYVSEAARRGPQSVYFGGQ